MNVAVHNSRYFLGRIALLENKPREAVAWLEPAVAWLEPVVAARETAFDTASQLALAYAGANLPRLAVAPLQQAIADAPWDGALCYRLGRIHQQLGEPELARHALQASERLKSTSREDVETLMEASRLMVAGRASEAEALGARILAREDADPNSRSASAYRRAWKRVAPSRSCCAFEPVAASSNTSGATKRGIRSIWYRVAAEIMRHCLPLRPLKVCGDCCDMIVPSGH